MALDKSPQICSLVGISPGNVFNWSSGAADDHCSSKGLQAGEVEKPVPRVRLQRCTTTPALHDFSAQDLFLQGGHLCPGLRFVVLQRSALMEINNPACVIS